MPGDRNGSDDTHLVGHLVPFISAGTLHQLQERYLDWVPEHLPAFATGIYLHDRRTGRPLLSQVRGLSRFYLSRYEQHGRDHDPVMGEAIRRKQVCDDTTVASADEWERLPVVNRVFREHGMAHVLCAPLVVDGEVVGTLNFARHESAGPFDEQDRRRAGIAASMIAAATFAISQRMGLERDRDRALAALDVCGQAIVITDLDRGERYYTRQARELCRSLGPQQPRLEPLLEGDHRGEVSFPGADGHEQRIAVASVSDPSQPDVTVSVLRVVGETAPRLPEEVARRLTQRERDIVELSLAGLEVREIGTRLFISPNTVKFHLKAVYRKLGVSSRLELMRRSLDG
jgi:DNA-binding CsgD family transcriptional regulator